jgi:hypothetical protein
MQSGNSRCFGAKGQQRVEGAFSLAAANTAAGRRANWIAIAPFDDAQRAGLGLFARQAAIMLRDAGSLIEVRQSVIRRPSVILRA